MITVNVPVGNAYDVIVGEGLSNMNLLSQKIFQAFPKTQKIAFITDKTVKGLYLEDIAQPIGRKLMIFDYAIPSGEASKSGENYLKILSWLAELGLTGTDLIIALGGGVVGDLAGFVAATYLRGISYLQMPTTLLAMVDSSVGGKTAIDLKSGKNLVGAFYQPFLVLCDTDFLKTLPTNILQDGYSEIIKYGMLGNAELLEKLASDHDIDEIIAICIEMKRDIVVRDEFDKGERNLLNFGHTIGHAIEQVSGYQISHPKAVAIGMAVDVRAAVRSGLCQEKVLITLLKLLEKYNLPSTTFYTAKELFEGTILDKKRSGDTITNVVPIGLGKCVLKDISMNALQMWIELGLEG